MIARIVFCLTGAALLSGCAVDVRDINREPHMTPVGTGLVPNRVAMISEPVPAAVYRGNNSIWQDSRADLFSDLRARKIGDTVTVKIFIKDKASIANDSERKRDASNTFGLDYAHEFGTDGWSASATGVLAANLNSNTKTKSEGGIERSEQIELLVAAVVSDVLPTATSSSADRRRCGSTTRCAY
jgi:flagellar L-ring protein precursor FlgH